MPVCSRAEHLVDDGQHVLVAPHVPARRHAVAQVERVELQQLLAARAPRREVGVELGDPRGRCTSTSCEEQRSSDASSSASNRYTWNGFSKSAGGSGVMTNAVPSSVADPRELGDVVLRRAKCSMMCDEHTQSTEPSRQPSAAAVHRGEAQARVRSPLVRPRRPRSAGRSRRRRPCGPGRESSAVSVADAAAHVEHDAGPDRARPSRGSRRRGTRAGSRGWRPAIGRSPVSFTAHPERGLMTVAVRRPGSRTRADGPR